MFISKIVARWILIIIGIVFIASGLVVTSLNLAHVIPTSYYWQGPSFLVLGTIGFFAAYIGLKKERLWILVLLFWLYVPWTIIGLIGDIKQGFWPLVIGECVGLIIVLLALFQTWKQSSFL